MHDFDKSLAYSHRAEDWAGWERVYREAFPSMVGMYNHRGDGEHQRAGIDRSVLLASGKQIQIDEKSRSRGDDGRVYTDILLEVWSDEERKRPGWVQKRLLCDYIAYLNRPAGFCYLLPVIQLQSAWARWGDKWSREYRQVLAPNPGYTTLSCPVPVAVLFPALGSCLRVKLDPDDDVPF